MSKVNLGTSTALTYGATSNCNQRKVHKTSAGKLIVLANTGNVLKYITSDDGITWGAWVTVYTSASTLYNFDSYIDTTDDIYVVYWDYTGFSHRLEFRKLTYSAGTWSVGAAILISSANSSTIVFTKRSNGDFWVARHRPGDNAIVYTISTDGGATWGSDATLSVVGSTGVYLTPYDTKIWLISQGGGKLTRFEYDSSFDAGVDITASGITNGSTAYPYPVTSLGVGRISDSEIYVVAPTSSGIKVFKWAGVSWDAGTLLSNNASDSAPSIGVVNAAPFVSWVDYDGSNYNISYRLFSEGAWLTQVDVTSDANIDKWVSAILSDSTNIYLVFTETTSNPNVIYFYKLAAPIPVAVSSVAADLITEDGARLNGEITNLGDELEVLAWFEYKKLGAGAWTETSPKETLAAIGVFSKAITSLDFPQNYEFRAKASYTDGSGEKSGSTLTFDTQKTFNLESDLEWYTKENKEKALDLEWYTKSNIEKSLSFEWETIWSPKFCPNLINFDFYWYTLSVTESKIPITATGCLFGYSIFLADTGSSGNTVIEIYINTTLKKTITIVADGGEYSEVYYFDMTDILYALDTLKVKVTSAAPSSSDLKVNLYEMSFPFKVERIYTGNYYGSTAFYGENYNKVFNSSNYWFIELNQPIQTLEFIKALDTNGTEVVLTGSIESGIFYNNRIKVTPYTAFQLSTIYFRVKDLSGESQTLEISVYHGKNYTEFLEYISTTTYTGYCYISPQYFSYSFDNITFSDWVAVTDNKVVIDFSAQVAGLKTLYLKYKKGSYEVRETKNIYYYTATLACAAAFYEDYAELTYTDSVPLKKVLVYEDTVLVNELTPITYTGFSSITVNNTLSTIVIGNGTVYFNNSKFDYTSITYTVTKDITKTHFQSLLFIFNTVTRTFYWKEVMGYPTQYVSDTNEEYIVYQTGVYVGENGAVLTTVFLNTSFYKYGVIATINYNTEKSIILRVYDISERYIDLVNNVTKTQYDIWRTITVTAGATTINQGKIHSNASLTFTLGKKGKR